MEITSYKLTLRKRIYLLKYIEQIQYSQNMGLLQISKVDKV